MIIDVALSSCGRMSMLEETLESFRKHIKTKHEFRLVICEDMVDDPIRQKVGREWIEKHKDEFDTVVYADRKLTYVYCFSEILKHINSPFFFRLEDDVKFTEDIDIDPMLEWMQEQDDVCQVCLMRDHHRLTNPEVVDWSGERKFIDNKFCSIATGLMNLSAMSGIVSQTENGECHETGVLTPIAMGQYRCILACGLQNKHCYLHIGKLKGFDKGKWK